MNALEFRKLCHSSYRCRGLHREKTVCCTRRISKSPCCPCNMFIIMDESSSCSSSAQHPHPPSSSSSSCSSSSLPPPPHHHHRRGHPDRDDPWHCHGSHNSKQSSRPENTKAAGPLRLKKIMMHFIACPQAVFASVLPCQGHLASRPEPRP